MKLLTADMAEKGYHFKSPLLRQYLINRYPETIYAALHYRLIYYLPSVSFIGLLL